jgi:hypothetical protein
MKLGKIICFRTLFVLTLFACYGYQTCAFFQHHGINDTEIGVLNQLELVFHDSMNDDDQVSGITQKTHFNDRNPQVIAIQKQFYFSSFFYSIWKPPRIS